MVQLFRNEMKEWYHVLEKRGIRCLCARTPVPYSDPNGKPKSLFFMKGQKPTRKANDKDINISAAKA